MPDYKHIYEHQAARYQELVAHEDPTGNLLQAIDTICPLNKTMEVADIGAGTGRVSFLLAPRVRRVFGVEPARAMREQAQAIKAERGVSNVDFMTGGYGAISLPAASVDLVVEGWSLLYYFVHFLGPDWRPALERALADLRRVLRPGGTIIFIETLGTMLDSPVRHDWAVPLYEYFENDLACGFKAIDTAFSFDTVEQAIDLIGFFFGPEMAAAVKRRGSTVVPSWTGLWWKRP